MRVDTGTRLLLAAYTSWPMNLTNSGPPERLRSVIVSGEFFDVAGSRPFAGRVPTPQDDGPSAPPVAVLSHGFWTRRFGANPAAIGKPIMLNGHVATIVGVMGPEFALPAADVDLWMPMGLAPAVLADRSGEWLSVIGRLRPGVSVSRLQAELQVTADQLARQYPQTNADDRTIVTTLLDDVVDAVRRPLWLGAVAVVFVLLAGSANAANLMLARSSVRHDEIAIRAALGADAGRLARQLVTESALLASLGCVAGVLLSWMFLRMFVVTC